MKDFYTFKVRTNEAMEAMKNAMSTLPEVKFETKTKFNITIKAMEATTGAWLTPEQVNKMINELYSHNGIKVTQYSNHKNTIFVSYS